MAKVFEQSSAEQTAFRFQSVIWTAALLALAGNSMHPAPACGQMLATPATGFQGIWYEVGGGGDYPNKYGGGLATYPQQIAPISIYDPLVNRTYFTVSLDLNTGAGRNIGHAVSYYDHNTGLVARPQVWLDKQTSDAHDAPVLALDDDGYLYLFSMNHGESRRASIRRSASSHSIDSYVDLLSPTSAEDMDVFGNPADNPGLSGDPRFSYAGAWYVPNTTEQEKFLLLHTRYLSGQRDLFTTSSQDADTWTTRKTLSQIESGQYQTSWIKPDGASVGTIFNIHPTGQGLDRRTDLYYLETSDQAQTWQTVDGLTLVDNRGSGNNPLASRPDGPGDGAALVYDAAPGERVYMKDVNYDPAGNPIIMFLTSPSHLPGDHGAPGPDRFVKTAHWNGSDWSIKDFTTTDHNYDHGSLHVESDGTWRVMAPFIDGPQAFGTGGEIGMWTSADQGTSWTLEKQLTDGFYNHTYVRRPLNAHEDFYALWADGDAWEQSDVHFYFANKNGDVFHLPFDTNQDFFSPEPYSPRPPDLTVSISGVLANVSVDGRIDSLRISMGGEARVFEMDDLSGGTLTAFGGQAGTGIADIIMPIGTIDPPPPEDRTGLLADDLADTGYVNMSSWAVTFEDDIQNREGPDIILIDWGSPDTIDITIDGTTLNDVSPTSEGIFQASMSNRPRFQSVETDVTSIAALQSATLNYFRDTASNATAFGIDLSDFGFADGAILTAGTEVSFSDGTTIDPLAVFGLPPAGFAADFDGDGNVDGDDFLVWQTGFGTPSGATRMEGDADEDGDVDGDDFLIWQTEFGSSGSRSEGSGVPEPGSLALLAVALLGGTMRRSLDHSDLT